jgi:S1-C subfamily serine protease
MQPKVSFVLKLFILIVAMLNILGVKTLSKVYAAELVETLKQVKPAVVGVGINAALSRPPNQLRGTGFLIGSGEYAVTNYHVVESVLDVNTSERRVVFIGEGEEPEVVGVEVVAFDAIHDLAVLKLERMPKAPFKALTLADENWISDGTDIAFTGFPIGAVLGLYPVTHRGIISARSPVAIPAANSGQLSLALLKRLKDPFFTYQLDATAYPGNSGSAVYVQSSGEVVAVVNKVLVRRTKEAALTDPSGITYAIPVKYLHDLLARSNIDI